MARKKIVWTETAARQRNSILQYWAEHNYQLEGNEAMKYFLGQ